MEMTNYVKNLINKHKTNDPFIIADNENIRYLYNDELSNNFDAVYLKIENYPTIIMNGKYQYNMERYFYMAHELFHALYHYETVAFYHNVTSEKAKNEREANEFATLLLLNDRIVYEGMTAGELLKDNYIPLEMSKFIE